MGARLERVVWGGILRTSHCYRDIGIPFYYFSAQANGSAAEIVANLKEATARIRDARGGFGELVQDHLRFVAALATVDSKILFHVRGYVSSFPRREVDNPHYLACRLVWAATWIRISRDQVAFGKVPDRDHLESAAHAAMVRFTEQFPDNHEWLDYLFRYPDGI